MKQLVYETVVETEEDLVARITVAADAIADMPGSEFHSLGRAIVKDDEYEEVRWDIYCNPLKLRYYVLYANYTTIIEIVSNIRAAAADHSVITQPLEDTDVASDHRNISYKMAACTETWSNMEVCNVIRFLRLKDTSPAEIHRQLVELYCAKLRFRLLFNDAVSITRIFSVDEISNSEMVFGKMRLRIRHRLPDIHLTVGGKNPTRSKTAYTVIIATVRSKNMFAFSSDERAFNIESFSHRYCRSFAYVITLQHRLIIPNINLTIQTYKSNHTFNYKTTLH
ncbi:hypothetical protein ANN_14633 [Periplaneta americana]|uniref:Uncharacterized protein n=1 Tax=Periplaneta americana TaxID=6978 RepID=A0ABQ8SWW4_PERAM|nr:hypothetical protein ANN_14633 [Periplaneta americana]